MKVQVKHTSVTEAVISIIPLEHELQAIKEHVLSHFQNRVKVPGFREGKVPADILEKHVDGNSLQSQFLHEAIEQLYTQAVQSQQLRVVGQPSIAVKKFVPYNTLEFEATVPVLGHITLPDYKKIKKSKPKVNIAAKDINDVLASLQTRAAEKTDVNRPAKNGDQVWIDFSGVDAKGQSVKGAESKNYPLMLGSKQFIPGFEENLLGLKANEVKTFTLTFPKNYAVKALANKKVTFSVTVSKVQSVQEPRLDDDFAAKIGPFKTLADLKADIKKQLTLERQREADRAYENELVQHISSKSTIALPKVLVDDQIERLEQEERQNLTYRGQTWQEHLDEEGVTAEQHKQQKRPAAEAQLKASLVLAEIAEAEKLSVTEQEIDTRLSELKAQYTDQQMQAELDKPEVRRDIASRILTEKTLEKLTSYGAKI